MYLPMNTAEHTLNESYTRKKARSFSIFKTTSLYIFLWKICWRVKYRGVHIPVFKQIIEMIKQEKPSTFKRQYCLYDIQVAWQLKKSSKPPICLYLCTSLPHLFIHAVTAQNLLMVITSLTYLHIDSNTILAMWVTVNFLFIWCLTWTCIDILPQMTQVLCKHDYLHDL